MSTITNAYIQSNTSTTVSINITWNTSGDAHGTTYYLRVMAQGNQMDSAATMSIVGAVSTTATLNVSNVDGFNFTGDVFIGRSFSDAGNWYRVSNETMYTATDESYPSYYPHLKDQWVYAAGDWQGQVGNCVAQAITTLKEIHEYREKGNTNYYSTGWVFGNRLATDNQSLDSMDITQALDRLVADGVPVSTMLPENSNIGSNYYPDNYFYDDRTFSGTFAIGAKTLVTNNKARQNVVDNAKLAKIASWSSITYRQKNISSIKQAIIDNGGVIVHISIANNFENIALFTSDGVLPKPDRWRTLQDYHTCVITGWKTINGIPHWIVHNNWGTWGDANRGGYCYMPFDYTFTLQVFVLVDASLPTETTGISATATSGHTFYVAWNTISGATGYLLYKSSDGGLNYYPWMGSGQTADVGNVTSKSGVPIDYEWQNYRFQVTPYNANGNGSNNYSIDYKSLDETVPSITQFYATQLLSNQITVYISGHDNNPISGTPSGIYRYRMYNGGSLVGYATVNGAANNSEQGTYYTYTGLVSKTTYTLEAIAEDYSGNLTTSGAWVITPTTVDRPSNFSWSTAKSSGGNFNVSSSEWTSLQNKINDFRIYKSLSSYGFAAVSSGQNFEAYLFNQAVSAISAMSPPTSTPSTVVTGQDIYASYLNGLVNSLNSIV